MKHILFIDPLSKLTISKDSSLLLAHTLRAYGHESYLLFEEDFYIHSDTSPNLRVFEYFSSLKKGDFYLDSFSLGVEKNMILGNDVLLHIRLDPPFDARYLKYLWMMNSLKRFGVRFLNDPSGIILFNEKLLAFQARHIETYVGNSLSRFLEFSQQLKSCDYESVILKPLDLYQGEGVEKVSLMDESQLKKSFLKKIDQYSGAIVVQPFMASIARGELRTIFWQERVLGSMIKIPQAGEYLANVARGASYSAVNLEEGVERECRVLSQKLIGQGLHWIAYDILDGCINEANVTCPGLLVEVSSSLGRNLALDLIREFV